MPGGLRVPAFPCGKTPTTEASSSATTNRDAAGSFRFPEPGPSTCGTTAFESAPNPTRGEFRDAVLARADSRDYSAIDTRPGSARSA
jgi:hypothetical protein